MLPKQMLDKLHCLNVKPYFYYDRRELVTTICLLYDGEQFISRGVSFCSPRDEFIKYTGRTKACGRAIKAMIGKEDSMLVRTLPVENGIYKSRYLPVLNSIEKKILKGIRDSYWSGLGTPHEN